MIDKLRKLIDSMSDETLKGKKESLKRICEESVKDANNLQCVSSIK